MAQEYIEGDLCGTPDYLPDCQVDSVDIACLIDYIFFGGPPPFPEKNADINCDGFPDSADLSVLIDFVFFGGDAPPDCGAGPGFMQAVSESISGMGPWTLRWSRLLNLPAWGVVGDTSGLWTAATTLRDDKGGVRIDGDCALVRLYRAATDAGASRGDSGDSNSMPASRGFHSGDDEPAQTEGGYDQLRSC